MTVADQPRQLEAMPGSLPESPFLDIAATQSRWLTRYARSLLVVDTAVLLLAGVLGSLVRFGTSAANDSSVHGVPYLVGSLVLIPVWITVLSLTRCYETRFLGTGTEEFKRVADASFRVVAVVVFLLYISKTDASRGFLLVSLMLGMLGVLAGRYAARIWLHRQRLRGNCMHKVVVVGPAAEALEMTTTLQSQPLTGLTVVGACVTGSTTPFIKESLVPVLGTLSDVLPVLERLGADTVVVSGGHGVSSEELRRLSYDLEGTGIDLFVSPSLMNVTGSRIHWRTTPGLALLHVEEPELVGGRRMVKAAFDRSVGLLLLLLIAPVLVACAVAIRLTSPGGAFFVQDRVGKSGETFRIWKLRTMYTDAEARLLEVAAHNVHGDEGVLFKIPDDPRITRVGTFLRRYSLDELPQLLNVVLGHMSLVGPRPPLPSEVERYDGHVHRRLLVKPGMTGLWQVSGRANLDWEESVRLDLHYVENWSLGLDIVVLAKTVIAVLRPNGAY